MIVEFSNKADKQLKKFDEKVALQILDFLSKIEKLENPKSDGRALRKNLSGLWRYRTGDYRVICEIKDNIINVLWIGHRKDAYKVTKQGRLL